MKKFKYNNIKTQFNKSKFREFTFSELTEVLSTYKLDLLLSSRILNGLDNNLHITSEEKTQINNIILNWIKVQINNDLIPPYSTDFMNMWRLIMYDSELNPNNLDSKVLYDSLTHSNNINKIKVIHKNGYHVNQGKFGNRKKK